jgi:hypothetical protein
MTRFAWVIVVLGLMQGAWLTFDGSRALIVGDYVTPSSGEYAGQLGPWSKVVTALGIPPRSTLMKSIHLALGLAWLVTTVAFISGAPWAWSTMIACSVLTLWYLPFGTLFGIIEIALLFLPGVRGRM